jgi:hypothetical protein
MAPGDTTVGSTPTTMTGVYTCRTALRFRKVSRTWCLLDISLKTIEQGWDAHLKVADANRQRLSHRKLRITKIMEAMCLHRLWVRSVVPHQL